MGSAARRGVRATRGRRSSPAGQTLVEFALVLLVFMLVTLGLLDGMRVIFYYSQIQEAARAGARWATVQVGRDVNGSPQWGTFNDPGNAPGVYTACHSAGCTYTPFGGTAASTGALSNTVVNAIGHTTTAVDLSQATINITTTIPATATEVLQVDSQLTNVPVTVTVQYPFTPILGMVFGGVTINLKGSSTMLHE